MPRRSKPSKPPRKKNAALYPGLRLAAVVDKAPPPQVLQERDTALAEYVDTTAELMGDPRPSRSALRRPRSPRVIRVPVDPSSVQRIMRMRAKRQAADVERVV